MQKTVSLFSVLLLIGLVFITSCQTTETPPPTQMLLSPTAPVPTNIPTDAPTATPLPPTQTRPSPTESEPIPTNTPTAVPTATPEPVTTLSDIPLLEREPADVYAYPGPEHYAGDILTFEIDTGTEYQDIPELAVTMIVMGHDAVEVTGTWQWYRIILVDALDTSDLEGPQRVTFEVRDEGYDIEKSYLFDVLPAAERPEQEAEAAWVQSEINCCILHTITQTAANRDIEELAALIQKSADDLAAETGASINQKLEIYFIDRMWGNGGFGGNGELLLVYTDRFYGPGDLETIIRHELTHAMNLGQPVEGRVFLLNEGLAVFLAGGHYKPEPLAQRGAAMVELGYSPSITEMFMAQHEVVYLKGAVLVSYIYEVYGEETLWEFVAAASIDPMTEPLELTDNAIQAVFGMSLDEFDQEFQNWLKGIDPGEQVDDLALTIQLQDLRRNYQEHYSLPPTFIFGKAADSFGLPEALPSLIREAREPENVAIELLIANAQAAIKEGRYEEAEALVNILEKLLSSKTFDDPVAADTLAIVTLLDELGYETLSLQMDGEQAVVMVTQSAPHLEELTLEKLEGGWQVVE